MQLPEKVKSAVINKFRNDENSAQIIDFQPFSGGCINNGGKLQTSLGHFFIKWNSSSKFPGMFRTEIKGLQLLSSTQTLRVPKTIHHGEDDDYSWILIEFIESAQKTSEYWSKLGRGLASLHRNSNESYGLDHNNYIGSLPQKNGFLDNWVEFFITRRLEPMVKMALGSGKIDENIAAGFEKLYPRLNSLLVYEPPSLLHGDLWSGNVIAGPNGEPVVLDPAVYYGNREIEIAFTKLFGGFDSAFYKSYNEAWPLQDDYQNRFEIYNLYPLMVHVNLFKGSYTNQVRQSLNQFL